MSALVRLTLIFILYFIYFCVWVLSRAHMSWSEDIGADSLLVPCWLQELNSVVSLVASAFIPPLTSLAPFMFI